MLKERTLTSWPLTVYRDQKVQLIYVRILYRSYYIYKVSLY